MFLLDWYQQFLAIRANFKSDPEICESCETLKMQLAIANDEKRQLLERILEKPEIPVDKPPEITRPIVVPWAVKKQMLEREDRAKAATILRQKEDERLAKEAMKKDEPVASIAEFEKELDDAQANRERSTGSGN